MQVKKLVGKLCLLLTFSVYGHTAKVHVSLQLERSKLKANKMGFFDIQKLT